MNIQTELKLLIESIDDKWFTQKLCAFDDHSLYDKKSDTLKWNITQKKHNFTKEEIQNLPDDFEIQKNDQKVIVQKTFSEFLYNSETTPEHKYIQPQNIFYDQYYTDDFLSLEKLCLHRIDQVVLLTSSIQEKYLIINNRIIHLACKAKVGNN
jgi:hypothetical protein